MCTGAGFLNKGCKFSSVKKGTNFLTLYVPCIVTNSVNKPTRYTFCMYLFYNLFATLHVSNVHFVHHQEFINLLYLQFYTNRAGGRCVGLTTLPLSRADCGIWEPQPPGTLWASLGL